jgi:subtilisin family serine protease
MRSKRFIGVMSVTTVLLMVLAGFAAVPGGAADDKMEVVVLFKDSIDEQVIKDNNGKVSKKFSAIPLAVTKLSAKDIRALERSDKVLAVEKNHIYSIAAPPPGKGKPDNEDPEPPAQPSEVLPWGVDRIDAEEVWIDGGEPSTGEGITVAVIDTGIDEDHPDLEANIIGGYNFVVQKGRLNRNAWDDDNGHGTHVSGTIAGIDNNIGVIGVAPDASLYGIKVLNKRGSGYMTDVIDGILWAADLNLGGGDKIDVISMSLSGPRSTSLMNAVNYASGKGIILVAASGNDYASSVSYPADYANVISVGATDSADKVASFSNYDADLDFVAPGVSVLSTYKNGGYATGSGTSMACPHVAGTVALLLGAGVLSGDVYSALSGSVTPLPNYAAKDGNGLVDAEKAVTGDTDGDD